MLMNEGEVRTLILDLAPMLETGETITTATVAAAGITASISNTTSTVTLTLSVPTGPRPNIRTTRCHLSCIGPSTHEEYSKTSMFSMLASRANNCMPHEISSICRVMRREQPSKKMR